jgi:hypothetical protein
MQLVRFLACAVVLLGVASVQAAGPVNSSTPAVASLLDAIPAWFEPNPGLDSGKTKYFSRGAGYQLALEDAGALLSLAGESGSVSLRLTLPGANPKPSMEALDPLPARTDYFIGSSPANWKRNVPHFGRVRYRNAYPGIDVDYRSNGRRLEYDFVVAAGADPARIRLRFEGAESLRLDADGSLVVAVGGREIRQPPPFVYQDVMTEGSTRRLSVAGSYVLARNGQVRFALGRYDRTEPLVIDPVLDYAGYFGGCGYDVPTGVAVDAQGNVWLTGTTRSNVTAPQATAPYQAQLNLLTSDVFVAKLSVPSSGQPTLLYWTYLGGSDADYGGQIAVNAEGKVYVSGSTLSINFPTTANALQTASGGVQDAFLAVLDPAANGAASLLYGTYLGGSGLDAATALTLGQNGAVLVAGYTASTNIAWITSGAVQTASRGGWEAFVVNLNPAAAAGTAALYASYLGGNRTDVANGVAVDASGNILLSGYTMSSDLPIYGDCYQCSLSSLSNAFLAKIDPSRIGLDGLLYTTFLGGSRQDFSTAMALDSAGGIWLTGYTFSPDFPVTQNAYQTTFAGGGIDAFLIRIDLSLPHAQAITYSTYFGGQGADISYDLLPLGAGKVLIAGYTLSGDLPVRGATGAGQSLSQSTDAFLALLDSSVSGDGGLDYAAYFGGAGTETATNVAVGPSGAVYVVGYTNSASLPVTDGSQRATPPGGLTGFLLRLDPSPGELVSPAPQFSDPGTSVLLDPPPASSDAAPRRTLPPRREQPARER